ncbi:nif11-like peptide radical SAM maturase [Metallumcola ferriviriculae]|uniref:Nif11-like peptide radical SAM maturase n=1 Tax=Metallumcola ferriviriculae TaxID=3039180 RepID=A0AAU0ULK7_9FIRM|nr:nif11-like peptide radical SAM maturase [Desulfitibacteraceae bacterium MK1]
MSTAKGMILFMNKKDIMPFHLVHHHGSHCVINIERMEANRIDRLTAETLNMIDNELEMSLPLDMEESLKKLGLISEDRKKKNNTTKKEAVPIVTMALFVTQTCNLKCVYCFGEGGEYGTGGTMEEKTALQAVDWLIEQSKEKKKINIVFFGGEPFLNFPLMKKVIQYAQQRVNEVDKKISFNVTTNATLLNDDVISFLEKHKVNVTVSIDGPKEIQDMQRPFTKGKGSYDIILPKIKKLLKALPETRGHAVIDESTDPILVTESLKKIGFLRITTAIMSASLFEGESCSVKPTKELSKILNMMELEAETWINDTKSKNSKSLKELIVNGNLYEGIFFILHNKKIHYPCGAGVGYLGVSCSGDVYPCHRFVGLDRYKLGNVFMEDLDRDMYHKPPRTFIKKCANCFAQYYCAGGCKHMNASSGDSVFKQSEDLCRLKRRELELSAYIYSMLDHEDHNFLLDHKIFPPKPCPLDF